MKTKELCDLVNTQGGTIFAFCYNLTQNKVDADDLYQETFLKALENCHRIDLTKNPKSFLISIAIGLWKNHQKKYARHQRITPRIQIIDNQEIDISNLSEKTPEERVISSEIGIILRREIEAMDNKFKIPMYLYYGVEMPVDAIAKILKIPSGTVKSRLSKARAVLKKRLEEQGYEE